MPSNSERSALGASSLAPAPSSTMERLSRPFAESAPSTRTCTSSPTRSSRAIFEVCTSPCATCSPCLTVTKAPKGSSRSTLPLSHLEESAPAKADRSRGAFSLTRERMSFSGEASLTQRVTSSPAFTTSATFAVKPALSLLRGTRPGRSAPMSTKAPILTTLVTLPRISCPMRRSPTGILAAPSAPDSDAAAATRERHWPAPT
mmetsp:Transcript_73308/g.192210  ORF Transcript_73308/g.192210 Transcript_73308/m.192210 type:complete len:203 (+) Transcript_73308:1197-1805(+)